MYRCYAYHEKRGGDTKVGEESGCNCVVLLASFLRRYSSYGGYVVVNRRISPDRIHRIE